MLIEFTAAAFARTRENAVLVQRMLLHI